MMFFDLETQGLSGMTNKIVSIGTKMGNNAPVFFFGNEEAALKGFVDYIDRNTIDTMCGFNVHQFDIPFLKTRLLVNDKVDSSRLVGLRYIDLRLQVNPLFSGRGKLSEFSEISGYEYKYKDLDGSSVPKMAEAGDWVGINNHLNDDLYGTEKLYRRLKAMGTRFKVYDF